MIPWYSPAFHPESTIKLYILSYTAGRLYGVCIITQFPRAKLEIELSRVWNTENLHEGTNRILPKGAYLTKALGSPCTDCFPRYISNSCANWLSACLVSSIY